jgi:YD repeat-containing protein
VRVQRFDAQYLVLAEVKVLAVGAVPVPTDGIANLAYDEATNRITSSGYEYDAAGNQIRARIAGGSSQRFRTTPPTDWCRFGAMTTQP